jgi:hypothetical protein
MHAILKVNNTVEEIATCRNKWMYVPCKENG